MPRNKRNWKGTSLLMPAKLLEDLDTAAEAQGFSSRADVIRAACKTFVSRSGNTAPAPAGHPVTSPVAAH